MKIHVPQNNVRARTARITDRGAFRAWLSVDIVTPPETEGKIRNSKFEIRKEDRRDKSTLQVGTLNHGSAHFRHAAQ
jgi:hypothetical protein